MNILSTPPSPANRPRIAGLRGHRPRNGFTLIELVVVMGIMLTLSFVVVGSYVGMTRAIAARAGINHLRNAVLLTRQHACMDGQRTYLYVLDGTNYVLCRRAGVVSDASPGSPAFYDYYSDLGHFTDTRGGSTNTAEGLRLYNLSRPTVAGGTPYAQVVNIRPTSRGWEVTTTLAGFFGVGQHYGIEVYPMRTLPRGFLFDEDSRGRAMYFDPNGAPGGISIIEIFEEVRPSVVQSVSVLNGRITVDTRGTDQ